MAGLYGLVREKHQESTAIGKLIKYGQDENRQWVKVSPYWEGMRPYPNDERGLFCKYLQRFIMKHIGCNLRVVDEQETTLLDPDGVWLYVEKVVGEGGEYGDNV